MRRKIHRQLMRWQRFVVVAILLGISLFVLLARSRQLPLPIIIGSSSALVISALLVGGYYYKWAWTGFSDSAYPKFDGVEFQHGKTLWDWMQLLIIPSVLAAAALLFNAQSTQTQLDITTDNQREAALQAYIDKMSELLLNGKLRTSEVGSEIRSVARTRTLSTLRQLDDTRKGQVLQFLHESHLISSTDTIIALAGSNLEGADLREANLIGVNLEGADLEGADLRRAHLLWANFIGVDLRDANLVGTNLVGANVTAADLREADLIGAELQGANLVAANLAGADLRDAKLIGIDLRRASLRAADLRAADLRAADLRAADLAGANLVGATITPEQLAQAASLQGTTMPDGSIHD